MSFFVLFGLNLNVHVPVTGQLKISLAHSRMVRYHSRIAQPSKNSYFAQDHSRMVSIPTLRRTYKYIYIYIY